MPEGRRRSDAIELDVGPSAIPLALADLHASLPVGAHVSLHFDTPPTAPITPAQVVAGAGFEVRSDDVEPAPPVEAVRADTLADTVTTGMRILFCGFNPSLHAARTGVPYAGPGNRFWPALLASELATRDRDPRHALEHHGVGMTDLVKRATPRAADLDRHELRDGLARVDALARWLRPALICIVGLGAWRQATSQQAESGRQTRTIGDRPVYLMPSTSGLNAATSLDVLVEHLLTADRLARQGLP